MTTTLSFSLGSLASLTPWPAAGFVLQIAGLFAAVGALVALCGELRGWTIERARVTSAWSTLGFVVGVGAKLAEVVV